MFLPLILDYDCIYPKKYSQNPMEDKRDVVHQESPAYVFGTPKHWMYIT